ncbi:MAG TPA: Spy/CpxP family protein refolding chaperone [Pyrinomonadaceae bacterium]|nr:Spy/CpxP family protein refolding chaperone [Pyrinomonadaceae bacterium]
MNKLGKIKTLTIASLSAVALAAPIAFAQSTTTTQDTPQATGERHGGHGKGWGDKSRGWGERGGRRGGMMFAGLNLTDDQKAKMKEIGQSFRESTKSLHEQLRAKRQELRQASSGGTFNEALATQKLQESAGLQAKLMGEQFRMRQQMLSVLTPEQKTQLEQKRAEFKAKRANHGEQKVQ